MSEEVYVDQEVEQQVCHVNSKTRPLFKEMLNQLGKNIAVGNSIIKYGDAICLLDEDQFESLFNRWVTKCCEQDIMRKTLCSDSSKRLE